MTVLNEGVGFCRPTHQLSVRPMQAVIELGAVVDVIHTVLNATHHANRHGAQDDRIAVALPGMGLKRGLAHPGHEIVLFGTTAALGAFGALDGVQTLIRRRMIKALDIAEVYYAPGERGTAFVRDRQVAKQTPGALRRARDRAARRGVLMPDAIRPRQPDPETLALHFGAAVVHIRAIEGAFGAAPLSIGTYGFSPSGSPAVLPILPDQTVRWADDAA